MRITAVNALVVNARMRNWVFVKVETDEGLHGWGEATLEWKTRGVVGAVEDLRRFVVGEDPFRIEHLFQIMYRQFFWKVGIEGMTAISGIEQALWDLKGKALGQPVYELLGGRVRDSVRVYNHLGGGTMEGMYESESLEQFAERALVVKDAGYTALKFMPVPRTEPVEGVRSVRAAERVVAAVREAVGPELDLMVDLHARTWPAMAIQYCRAFEPYGLLFFEEPCPTEDLEATAQVTRASPSRSRPASDSWGVTSSASCSSDGPATSCSPTSRTAAGSGRLARSPRWRRPTRWPSLRTTRTARLRPPPPCTSPSRRPTG